MVVFDTSTLILLIDPNARPPTSPTTGQPLSKCKERIEYLVNHLNHAKTRILIPTPVLSEFLVKAGPNKNDFLQTFLESSRFSVGAFEERAAIELAFLEDADLSSGRSLSRNESKAKVKFDRQIVAIAKVRGASTIYTDDGTLAAVSKRNGINPVMTWDLPLPPVDPQMPLEMDQEE